MKSLLSKSLAAVGLFALASYSNEALAQDNARDYAIAATAVLQTSPPRITLKWPHDAKAKSFSLFRRVLGDVNNGWGSAHVVPVGDSTYIDNSVTPGVTYEYRLQENAVGSRAYNPISFVAAGIDLALPATPGIVILVVDKTYATDLAPELDRLIADLHGEGWGVIRHDVGRTDSVTQVKALIQKDYNDDPTHVRSLFLFGHVPVPYSGDIAPDGHVPGSGNHQGAWAADVYYGAFDATWTDTDVNDTTAYRQENKNIPGDGKFDASSLDAPMNLEVGRVDLANLPSFTKSEKDLLKQYLDKDHAFRTKQLVVPKRALVNINFGVFNNYDVPGEDAWRNFPMLVGNQNIVDFKAVGGGAGDWSHYIDTAQFMWAYGCGPGYYNSCGGVSTTPQFAATGGKSLFYMLFGSFFGDWDASDDLTRAPLATEYGLTSCWVSRPFWYFHPLAAGETFGYCTKLTQSDGISGTDYLLGVQQAGVHVALMGDPTLRMEYASDPPTALRVSQQGKTLGLSWTAPVNAVEGYNIYRAKGYNTAFSKINAALVTSTSFTDATPASDSNIYVVRAVNPLTTPTATLMNESGGASAAAVYRAGVASNVAQVSSLSISQNSERIEVDYRADNAGFAKISIFDVTGREVALLTNTTLQPGEHQYRVNANELPNGAYFVRVSSAFGQQSAKFVIER